MEITGRVAQANGRLKAANTGVSIEVKGNRFVLRATLPPRPGSKIESPYQQRIFLSYHANPAGLKLAEQEARKVGALLDCGEFDWSEYVKADVKNDIQTVKDWLTQFEQDYFTRRKRSPESETTWRHDYQKVFCKLPPGESLSTELLKAAIEATEPDSRTRKRFVDVLTRLAEFAGLEVNFKPLRGNYSPKQVTPRNLPTDELIATFRESIPNSEWQRAYGLIATYGLRPHEIFKCSLEKFPVLTVYEATKTGSRLVYPYFPEWAEQWQLKGKLPTVTGRNNSDLGNRVTHAFSRYQCPFKPYDLRHCWAVRTIRFGLPDTLAARQMGHSVAVHTEIYHAWISADEQERMFQVLMSRGDRPLAP